MAFLGGEIIKARKADLFEEGFCDDDLVNQCSYDLRLGDEYYISGHRMPERLSERKPYISLAPGEFAILTCHERLQLKPEVMAFITLRNRFKMQGLVNISGFHVDPTFKGRLVFAVQNVGPNDIRLERLRPTFTIFFSDVEKPLTRIRPSRDGIELEDVQSLGASSITLNKLKRDLETIRTMLLIYAPFAIALLIALIVNLIRK
jgi:dCTP deaminase